MSLQQYALRDPADLRANKVSSSCAIPWPLYDVNERLIRSPSNAVTPSVTTVGASDVCLLSRLNYGTRQVVD